MSRPAVLYALFFAVVFCLVSCAGPCAKEELPARYGAPQFSNVWLVTTPTGRGSCFPILQQLEGDRWRVYFLTAGHVVMDLGSHLQSDWIQITDPNGLVYEAEIEAVCNDWDIDDVATYVDDVAVLTALIDDYIDLLALSNREARQGDVILSAGYSQGQQLRLWRGIASGKDQGTAAAWPGVSGGPIFLENGKVIGIMSQQQHNGHIPMTNVTFYCSISEVRDWLDRVLP